MADNKSIFDRVVDSAHDGLLYAGLRIRGLWDGQYKKDAEGAKTLSALEKWRRGEITTQQFIEEGGVSATKVLATEGLRAAGFGLTGVTGELIGGTLERAIDQHPDEAKTVIGKITALIEGFWTGVMSLFNKILSGIGLGSLIGSPSTTQVTQPNGPDEIVKHFMQQLQFGASKAPLTADVVAAFCKITNTQTGTDGKLTKETVDKFIEMMNENPTKASDMGLNSVTLDQLNKKIGEPIVVVQPPSAAAPPSVSINTLTEEQRGIIVDQMTDVQTKGPAATITPEFIALLAQLTGKKAGPDNTLTKEMVAGFADMMAGNPTLASSLRFNDITLDGLNSKANSNAKEGAVSPNASGTSQEASRQSPPVPAPAVAAFDPMHYLALDRVQKTIGDQLTALQTKGPAATTLTPEFIDVLSQLTGKKPDSDNTLTKEMVAGFADIMDGNPTLASTLRWNPLTKSLLQAKALPSDGGNFISQDHRQASVLSGGIARMTDDRQLAAAH